MIRACNRPSVAPPFETPNLNSVSEMTVEPGLMVARISLSICQGVCTRENDFILTRSSEAEQVVNVQLMCSFSVNYGVILKSL